MEQKNIFNNYCKNISEWNNEFDSINSLVEIFYQLKNIYGLKDFDDNILRKLIQNNKDITCLDDEMVFEIYDSHNAFKYWWYDYKNWDKSVVHLSAESSTAIMNDIKFYFYCYGQKDIKDDSFLTYLCNRLNDFEKNTNVSDWLSILTKIRENPNIDKNLECIQDLMTYPFDISKISKFDINNYDHILLDYYKYFHDNFNDIFDTFGSKEAINKIRRALNNNERIEIIKNNFGFPRIRQYSLISNIDGKIKEFIDFEKPISIIDEDIDYYIAYYEEDCSNLIEHANDEFWLINNLMNIQFFRNEIQIAIELGYRGFNKESLQSIRRGDELLLQNIDICCEELDYNIFYPEKFWWNHFKRIKTSGIPYPNLEEYYRDYYLLLNFITENNTKLSIINM